MPKYTDEEGNEVEFDLTPEEIAALKTQKEELQIKAAELETLKEKADKQEEELKGLRSKDFNFKRYRESEESEKKKMLEEFSEKERAAIQAAESAATEASDLRNTLLGGWKESILSELAGDDKDLRDQIEAASKNFVGTPKTQQEIEQLYVNAMTIVKGSKPEVKLLNRYAPVRDRVSGGNPNEDKKDYTKTPDGEANYKNWFPDSPANKKEE